MSAHKRTRGAKPRLKVVNGYADIVDQMALQMLFDNPDERELVLGLARDAAVELLARKGYTMTDLIGQPLEQAEKLMGKVQMYRIASGLSPAEMALRTGRSLDEIMLIESGDANVRLFTVNDCLRVFGEELWVDFSRSSLPLQVVGRAFLYGILSTEDMKDFSRKVMYGLKFRQRNR